jgi:hypothetical protein
MVANGGVPFSEDQDDAKRFLKLLDQWGNREAFSRSVSDRLQPPQCRYDGPNAPEES